VSPRRRIDDAGRDYFAEPVAAPTPPLRWGLTVTSIIAFVVAATAIAGSIFVSVNHESDRRTELRDASALGYVRGFMTTYTTLDPFHANDYTDRIFGQATGEFAKEFADKRNEILVQVARTEPTTGNVLEAGVQRWNDNGSAEVLVAVAVTTAAPAGKPTTESASRWLVTTTEEGQQWKISKLIQVI
jgi:Mce-associated membrane protein